METNENDSMTSKLLGFMKDSVKTKYFMITGLSQEKTIEDTT